MINQLFAIQPDFEFINKIIKIIGLNDLNDRTEIIGTKLNILNVSAQFRNIKPEFEKYYLNCKKDKYLSKWNTKSCITIVRQILRTIDYDLIAKEKMINCCKVMCYKLVTKSEKKTIKNNKIVNRTVVNFD